MIELESLAKRYFDYLYKADLASDRFKALSPDEQAVLIDKGMIKCRVFIQNQLARIEQKDLDLYFNHSLQPDNRFSRELFLTITGISLPKGKRDTQEAVAEWLGRERIAAVLAEQERKGQEAIQEAERQKQEEHAKHIAEVSEHVKADREIPGSDLIDLCRALNVEVHPRTVKAVRDHIRAVNSDGWTHAKDYRSSVCLTLYRQCRRLLLPSEALPV